jgi:hypothetical protein
MITPPVRRKSVHFSELDPPGMKAPGDDFLRLVPTAEQGWRQPRASTLRGRAAVAVLAAE